MMRIWRSALILVLLLVGPGLPAAESESSKNFSQQDFSALVNATSEAVLAKLKGAKTSEARPAHATAPADGQVIDPVNRGFVAVLEQGAHALSSFPLLLAELSRIPGRLDASSAGGPDAGLFGLRLAAAMILALGTEAALRRVLKPATTRLAARVDGRSGIAVLALVASTESLGLLAVWLLSYGFVVAWFPGADLQARFGAAVLASLVAWRMYMLALRLVLQPDLPAARIIESPDDDARSLYRTMSGMIVLVIVGRVLLHNLVAPAAPSDVVACGRLLFAFLIIPSLVLSAVHLRLPVARWLCPPDLSGAMLPFWQFLARFWLGLALPLCAVSGLTQAYGAITRNFTIPDVLALTMTALIGLVLLEALITKLLWMAWGDPQTVDQQTRSRAVRAIARCVRVALVVGVTTLVAETWAVDVFGLVSATGYRVAARSALSVGLTLFVAYCAWEAVHFATGSNPASGRPALPGLMDETETRRLQGSRLSTLMPLLRMAMVVVICVLAVLIVLSQMGVNVTPLIAGASVAGLAVSFGSQTLVKDIVSGVFYLIDDAFRIGEYIDCGEAKGTVEGFTMRSLRLRHQNGQIHTIPFGHLGKITNFSRDWTTVKFNLRFQRDTDVEKLRKTVKKIGAEMLVDPEMKDEILAPLKMQGIVDIADNALVVRFKFTVRPMKPTFVQREAIKRMIAKFAEANIEFANVVVAVQTSSGATDHAREGAAAIGALTKVKADSAGDDH